MSDYLVLARKYRSAAFEDVVGQEHVATTLVNAIKSGRIAHAFLFAGTRGVGKTTVARILAKALNCLKSDGPTPSPCNECPACVSIARGEDVDVVEIDGASNRGIDEIRELRNNAIYRPARCRYKVYYIDEVHMLTREAFNALLKTLEEPPGHVKFIFATTEPEKLPATIVSRCQRFDFRDIPTQLIADHLENVCKSEKAPIEPGAVFRIARAAAGSMRDGLSLLDQLLAASDGKVGEDDVVRVLGTPSDEKTASIVRSIAEGDTAGALESLGSLLQSGLTLDSAVAALGEMFRQMMLAASCGADSPLIELAQTQKKAVAELAEKFTLPVLVQAVGLCQTTSRNLRGLTLGRGLVEAMLVRLSEADKFVDAASLLERLESLGRVGPLVPPGRPGTPPPAAGQKKKMVKTGQAQGPGVADSRRSDEPAPSGDGQAEVSDAPQLENPQWTVEYLRENWTSVVSALNGGRHGHVAGLLRPAKVLGLEGQALRLGYDLAHETIRRRCDGRLDETITSALGKMFGRQVTCQYVSTGEPGTAPQPATANTAVSSARRAEIANDPAVKTVLDFFGGTVTDIGPAAASAEEVRNGGDMED